MTDWEEQRRSFAYGNTNIDNPNVTREMVAAAADRLTGIDTIDRLDAELAEAHSYWDKHYWKVRLANRYPELRAELLRLQEERDEAKRDYSTALANLIEEYTHCEQQQREAAKAREQRDALLEALKGSVEAMEYELEHTCDDDGDGEPCIGITGLLEALPKARSAIANVEGKE